MLLITANVAGQLSAPGSNTDIPTQYPTFPETDNIFIFCIQEEGARPAGLQVQTSLEGTKTFTWQKYNNITSTYDLYYSESLETQQSSITGLESGGYRVIISQGETEEVFRAWVFYNLLSATAAIGNSDCESFMLQGNFTSTPMTYYDLSSNTAIELPNNISTEWLIGETVIGNTPELNIFNPPSAVTEYTIRISDSYGCQTTATVLFESLGPVAAFSASPMQGEAPLTLNFTNQSANADPNLYEWFFYKDIDQIKRESEGTSQPIDSIMDTSTEQNPVYTFENSGNYKVKLVAKQTSEDQICTDTAYLDGFIMVDTSFIAAPNVFTPNGDGDNDLFVVKFWSMQSIKISIFNRWGKRIHFWESNNVSGFGDSFSEAVWDGRVGGRFASPGVYYYVVEGRGRDNKARRANGFFHLFRGKD
ncbi:MAG TPA: gliding motility-associated C-terminal domain-containing protein [Mariniphaga sp.]|nr:gliding motility-associated C-terminal domain-containing protein [Mariniphaga sp.]